MKAFAAIYRVWATILTVAVVVQIFFAGFGAFDTVHKASNGTVDNDSVETSFGAHIGLGYLILLGTLIFVLISFGTRDRKRIYRALGVFALLFLQVVLASAGESTPFVGGLHPVNAFIILGLLGSITYREWKSRSEVAEKVASASASPAA
jgi:Family of unknown function (DUF6220)